MWIQINNQKSDVQIISTRNTVARLVESEAGISHPNPSLRRLSKPAHYHFTHFTPGLRPMPRATFK